MVCKIFVVHLLLIYKLDYSLSEIKCMVTPIISRDSVKLSSDIHSAAKSLAYKPTHSTVYEGFSDEEDQYNPAKSE